MSVRVRFAPSPTGKVHIGNIRAAIFNYLFARNSGGKFLLRIEDTDIERSTKEAIDALFDVMTWLGLDYDEKELYQTSQAENHLKAAEQLIVQGDAYRHAKGDTGEAVLFRIPWNCDNIKGIKTVGTESFKIHPEVPVKIDYTGLAFAQVSKKGKAMDSEACLAGFKDLEILDANDEVIFTLNDKIDAILSGESIEPISGGTSFRFTRRAISYTDLVKGELVKPLDSMKDIVIVRSNGTPIFHLSNICDDITQKITHIVRGDDHVENTYRHLLIYNALGAEVPEYAHLPMIVNQAGKPYSKRDGDAFVGDFREKGFLPEALFNYLSLLGWSAGDDREKMSIDELIAAFSMDRVKSNAAQMDMKKLTNLNSQYIAEMPADKFCEITKDIYTKDGAQVDSETFEKVALLMQSRTNLFTDCKSWDYFFTDEIQYDEKAVKKTIAKGETAQYLLELGEKLNSLDTFSQDNIDACLKAVAISHDQAEFKLHQPFRVAICGITNGAGVLEIAELLGKDCICQRLANIKTLITD
ncbi:MAG: glutamate--tRNA ligase [Lentisphaeria bacterium]|nr:glutamate--tRNA ligase [Lentisphaeria bacterium]